MATALPDLFMPYDSSECGEVEAVFEYATLSTCRKVAEDRGVKASVMSSTPRREPLGHPYSGELAKPQRFWQDGLRACDPTIHPE